MLEPILNGMVRHGLTLDAGAMALGLPPRMLVYHRSGEKPVPRAVTLVCLACEAEQRLVA